MSYIEKESSTSESQPVEFYNFKGTYKSYYMTSDDRAHIINSVVYEPVDGLKRSSQPISTHSSDNSDLTIEIPITEQLIIDYGLQTTPPSLFLTIYRKQREESEVVTAWSGEVSGFAVTGEFATVKIPSKFASMLSGSIPNVYVQPPCNHVLFDELCRVGRSENSVTTNITSVDGRTVVIADNGAFSEGWFVGGEIAIPSRNERRMIIAQDGLQMTVNYEFSNLKVGDDVQVTAGCDHSFEGENGCPKFNNQKNFGGCPYVPGDSNNVFATGA